MGEQVTGSTVALGGLNDSPVLVGVLEVYWWMAPSMGEACQSVAHLIVDALLQSVSGRGGGTAIALARTTVAQVERILTALLRAAHPARALSLLSERISSVSAPAIQVATKILGNIAAISPPALVHLHLDDILPPLFRAFAHPHADVRKAVVFCLVDLYRALGADLWPYLDEGLSNSQLKLVTIYINRLQ